MWQSFSRVRAYAYASHLCLTESILVTATVQGILSCLTVTFWGSVRAPITPPTLRTPLRSLQFSDRYGRVRYLGFNTTCLLLSDIAVTALAVVPEYVPGNYWILVFASAFEGLIGGTFRFFDFDDAK